MVGNYYEERHWREHNKAKRWLTKALLWTGFWTLVASLIFLPLSFLVTGGFSAESFEEVKAFYRKLLHQPAHLLAMYLYSIKDLIFGEDLPLGFYIPALTFVVLFLGIMHSIIDNPFYFGPNFFGSGRWANDRDIKAMKLLDGFLMVLGKWKGKYLKFPEIFSALCVSAPNTGKTTGVVIPTILETDSVCMFINDTKGELFEKTAGYRATLGPVFKMYWEGRDDPEKGIYWPCWNILYHPNLPTREYGRAEVVEGTVENLIPDGPEGTDPYWIHAGRSALTGLALYIVDKVEQAQANDYFLSRILEDELDDEDYDVLISYYGAMEQTEAVANAHKMAKKHKINKDNYVSVGTWDGIPKMWKGRESSFAMIVDWMTTMQMKHSTELKDRRERGDIAAYSIDPWDIILTDVLRECTYFGYDRRTILEINDLLIMPSKQRSSVLSTAISGLSIFKNGAIRARTSTSDFYDSFCRGWKNPETGEWEVITVYLCIPPLDVSSTATLSSLFLNNEMVCQNIFPPMHLGRGPYTVMFIMDDLHTLPKIGAMSTCISVGRWQKASYLLVVQDFSQISSKYGESAVSVLITNTAAKICLGTNNDTSAQIFKGLVTNRTAKSRSVSQNEGIGASWASPFIKNISYKYEKDSLLAVVNYETMMPDKQLLLYQRYMNRPILADRTYYYKDKNMLAKASIPPPPPLPKYIYDLRSPEQRDLPVNLMAVEGLEEHKIADDEALAADYESDLEAEAEEYEDEEGEGESKEKSKEKGKEKNEEDSSPKPKKKADK